LATLSSAEHKVKSEYLCEIRKLNLSLSKIMSDFPAIEEEVSVSFPSLDNNIWVSYPQVEALIQTRLGNLSTEDVDPVFRPGSSWRRSFFGITAELILKVFSSRFRVRSMRKPVRDYGGGATLCLTYSDFDPLSDKFFERSTYWGPLPGWFANDSKFTWVGVGFKKTTTRFKWAKPASTSGTIKLLSRFLFSIPIRIKVWRRLQVALRREPLFALLRKEFFRGIFGAPALEAYFLKTEFDILLSQTKPKAVLIPHENQMWERILSLECGRKGITLAGVAHTTPKFWDLRFFDFGSFSHLQPSVFIDNGSSSRELLVASGISPVRIFSGSALRFETQPTTKAFAPEKELTLSGATALLISGGNRRVVKEMTDAVISFDSLKDYSLVFRPHPSMTRWFRKHFHGKPTDQRKVSLLLSDYDVFIVDSMSSMALELAAQGAKVCVYLPKSSLNFSPLASIPNFDAYFKDDRSLCKILKAPVSSFDMADLMEIVSVKKVWVTLLEGIESYERN